MKIQIDTVNKRIRLDEEVNLKEFIDFIRTILPKNKWEEFTLDYTIIKDWVNPIVIPYNPPQPFITSPMYPNEPIITPTYPDPNQPWYTTTINNKTELVDGVFNVLTSNKLDLENK